jgi:hypothetical protein
MEWHYVVITPTDVVTYPTLAEAFAAITATLSRMTEDYQPEAKVSIVPIRTVRGDGEKGK